jgi:hypothetical protein
MRCEPVATYVRVEHKDSLDGHAFPCTDRIFVAPSFPTSPFLRLSLANRVVLVSSYRLRHPSVDSAC